MAKKWENYLKIYLFIRITLYMVYQVGYFTVLVIFVLKLYCTNYNILRLQTMKNRDSWRNTSNRLTKCRRRADKIKSSTNWVQYRSLLHGAPVIHRETYNDQQDSRLKAVICECLYCDTSGILNRQSRAERQNRTKYQNWRLNCR